MKKGKVLFPCMIIIVALFTIVMDYTSIKALPPGSCWNCIMRGDLYNCEDGAASGTITKCTMPNPNTCQEGTGKCGS
jgi:hypothetical protein